MPGIQASAGFGYVCFIIDVFSRMIAGRSVVRPSHADKNCVGRDRDGLMVQRRQLPGLRCHSEAGAQLPSTRYGEGLAKIGAVPSIGSGGASYDNALAKTVNGYYKAEIVRGPARKGPWKTVERLELAAFTWVHWHDTERLHGYLSDVTPAEFEKAFYAGSTQRKKLSGIT